jgi:hypothetical protein
MVSSVRALARASQGDFGTQHSLFHSVDVAPQGVIDFVNTADDSDEVPNVEAGTTKYAEFKLSAEDWHLSELIFEVLTVCTQVSFILCVADILGAQESWKMHKEFSGEKEPSLWKVLPGLEAFMRKWRAMAENPRYAKIAYAIEAGIKIIEKYYDKSDNAGANIVSLCESSFSSPAAAQSVHDLARSSSRPQGTVLQEVLNHAWPKARP